MNQGNLCCTDSYATDTWRIRDEPDKKDDDRFFGLRDQSCFESFRVWFLSYYFIIMLISFNGQILDRSNC